MDNLNTYYNKTFNNKNDFVEFFIDKAKLYLKVDSDFEDDIIKTLILSAISTFESKISWKFDKLELVDIPSAELYFLAFISTGYNNRELTIESTKNNINRMFSSILMNIRYKYAGKINGS